MSDAPTGLADVPVAGTASDARELLMLSSQLREKDQLVAALTERLEQAAEQLDRLRRTGVDKGRRPLATGAGGSAPDWLHEHRPTFDDLKRVLSNWDEIQPGSTLGRIESQLADLRDLLAAGAAPPPLPPPLRESASNARPAPATATPPPAPKAAAKGSGNDWWEAQKAALLGNAPPAVEESAQATSAAQPPTASSPADEPGEMAGSRTSLAEFKIPDALPPLDFETLTLEEAKQALRVRDAIIEQLREPLLLSQMAGEMPRDLQSIDQLPEPVRQRLSDIEAHWQAKFRQIELDLSLERARLGREQAQLKHQQDLLQKQLKHLGHAPAGAADADESDDSKSRRRWFRFMGKPGDEAKPGGE